MGVFGPNGQTDRRIFLLDPKHTEMVGYGDFEMKKNEHDCLKSDRDFSRKNYVRVGIISYLETGKAEGTSSFQSLIS